VFSGKTGGNKLFFLYIKAGTQTGQRGWPRRLKKNQPSDCASKESHSRLLASFGGGLHTLLDSSRVGWIAIDFHASQPHPAQDPFPPRVVIGKVHLHHPRLQARQDKPLQAPTSPCDAIFACTSPASTTTAFVVLHPNTFLRLGTSDCSLRSPTSDKI
jgi:hypothetical protein